MTITINANTVKPTKQKAYQLVSEHLNLGIDMTQAELAELLLYFAPAIPKTPKEAWQWVAKAVANKDARYYLNYMHVKNGVIEATNGHILKWCATDLTDGFYDKQTLAKFAIDAKFPDTDRVKPTCKDLKTYFIKDLEVKTTDSKYWNYIINGVAFQKQYIDQCVDTNQDCIHIAITGPKDAAYGKHEHGEFVIMPCAL